MKVSVNSLKWNNQQYHSSDSTELQDVPELVRRIGSQLGAVEEVITTGAKYDQVIVARVVTCEDHPNADRLHVCTIDDGGKSQGVARGEDGHVTVVCGAPNVRAGMLVAWLPPGSTVPSTVDKDPFVLEARELRGVVSNGMLASPRELGISDDHEGLLEIKAEDVGEELAQPGTPFKKLYGLDDTIIDIENKMFTHRPDCFGELGVAREIAGIFAKPFRSPEWYRQPQAPAAGEGLQYRVTNELPELCPRYMLIGLDGVTVGPSPLWLQAYLNRLGLRSINNIVDITNYLMLLTGQPLHAFDYDKVVTNDTAHIVVRHPKADENVELLDGRTITPRQAAILICNEAVPVGLGGMMGAANSEISAETTRVLIECANFDMYNIRRSSMEHGIFSDAVTRFTKGQSPRQCPAVLYKAIEMVMELSPGARVAGPVIDDFAAKDKPQPAVTVQASFINERLGLQLSAEDMAVLLRNVECEVTVADDAFTVQPPFWRTDIEIPEDVLEEVGRLYGFDRLPLELPTRSLKPAKRNPQLDMNQRLRACLARAGANELLTYSFVHGDLLQKVGQDTAQAFQLSNALSPDLQYYRLSLTPSLLDKVHANLKAGHDQFALFEIGKVHTKLHAKGDDELPTEFHNLALVVAGTDKATAGHGAAFYQARKMLDYVADSLGVTLTYEPLPASAEYPVLKPFAANRSALVTLAGTSKVLGVVGEYAPQVRKALKLPTYAAGFEIGLAELQAAAAQATHYIPLARFPKVQQDITLRVAADMPFAKVHDFLQRSLVAPDNCLVSWQALDIYQSDQNPDSKQLTFRLTIASYERTLTDAEVNTMLDTLAEQAKTTLGAERL